MDSSRLHAVAVVSAACLAIFAASGLIFGSPALYPELYSLGFLDDTCGAKEAMACRAVPDRSSKCCDTQSDAYAVVFTVGYFLSDAAAAPWGEVADRLGGLICASAAMLAAALSLTLLAVGTRLPSDGLLIGSIEAISLAGPGVFSGAFVGCLAKLGPTTAQSVWAEAGLSAFSAGIFNLSSLVFPLVLLLASCTGISICGACILWACVIVAIGGMLAGALRRDPEAPLSSQPQSVTEEKGSPEVAGTRLTEATSLVRKRAENQRDCPLLTCFFAAHNLCLLFFMSALNLAQTFYLVTVDDQLVTILGERSERIIGEALSTAFPITGCLTALVAWPLLARYQEREYVYWSVALVLNALFCAFSLMPADAAQLCAALIFGPARTMLWASYFWFVSTERRYEREMTGRVIGYNNTIIAMLGNWPAIVLVATIEPDRIGQWGGSRAGRYYWVKGCLLVFVIASGVLPAHLRQTYRWSDGRRRTS